jgi:hypothetical protein
MDPKSGQVRQTFDHNTDPLHEPIGAAQRRDQTPPDVVGIFPNKVAITRLVAR